MKKIVRGKYVDGAIRLLDDIRLDGNVDIYVIIEEREGCSACIERSEK